MIKTRKNSLYLILALITAIILFSTSAISNQCGSAAIEEEKVGVEEEEEEAASEEEEIIETTEETEKEIENNEYAGWKTYVNDVYGCEFNYHEGTEISETNKSCITITYKLGYIIMCGPENEVDECGMRTGVGSEYEVKEIEEKLIIDGKEYTAKGVELIGESETLDNHQEFLRVNLDDGTRIEYGSIVDETATYEDFLKIKEIIIKIVESYKRRA